MKLFIEEAHEELVKIQRHFPAWDQNPMDRESLVTVRRSFHTLKGSGRMVGARELGEFAWSIENLLNRVLDNTLTRTPAIVNVLREADSILQQEIRKAGLYRDLWQSFCVLPDVRTVGVQGDERTYGYVVVVRAVTSDDAMTAGMPNRQRPAQPCGRGSQGERPADSGRRLHNGERCSLWRFGKVP